MFMCLSLEMKYQIFTGGKTTTNPKCQMNAFCSIKKKKEKKKRKWIYNREKRILGH